MSSLFLSSVLHRFLLPMLILGVLWGARPKVAVRSLVASSMLGLLLGQLLWRVSVPGQSFRLALALFTVGVLALVLLALLLPALARKLVPLLQVLLTALAAFSFLDDPSIVAFTATSVINTELILNAAAVVLGLLLAGGVQYASLTLSRRLPGLGRGLAILVVALSLLALSGELLLAMIKLSLLELTKERLSYISRVIHFSVFYTYLALALLALWAGIYHWHEVRPLGSARRGLGGVALRKAKAVYFHARGQRRFATLITVIAAASLLYWDAYASRPPRLSEAQRVQLAADGQVHLALAPLTDGKLHRFAWVATDGKLVRFFVINRYSDRVKLGVVFDACLLCGDVGYIQKGNEVICISCDVRLFGPSIGKPGGCNPIPIANWSVQNDELLIGEAALEKGLQYFNTVLEVEVADPVTGDKLINLRAPRQYSYAGKTYFFAGEDSYEAFRADPERYLGE